MFVKLNTLEPIIIRRWTLFKIWRLISCQCVNRNTSFEPLSVQIGPKLRPVYWPRKRKNRKKAGVESNKSVIFHHNLEAPFRNRFASNLVSLKILPTYSYLPSLISNYALVFFRLRGGNKAFFLKKANGLYNSAMRLWSKLMGLCRLLSRVVIIELSSGVHCGVNICQIKQSFSPKKTTSFSTVLQFQLYQ